MGIKLKPKNSENYFRKKLTMEKAITSNKIPVQSIWRTFQFSNICKSFKCPTKKCYYQEKVYAKHCKDYQDFLTIFFLSFSWQIFLMYVKSAQGLSRSNIITLQKCRNFTEFPGVVILWKYTISA